MLPVGDFLFPSELTVSGSGISACLFIGSCMAEDYLRYFRERLPKVEFDFILFNHATDLGEPPRPLEGFDFQFVQIPLRSVIGDVIIGFSKFSSDETNHAIVANARKTLLFMLETATKFGQSGALPTFIQNFIVPQLPAVASINNVGSSYDLRRLIQDLNAIIHDYVAEHANFYLIDAECIAASMGKRYFLDDSLTFFTHGGFWFSDWVNYEGGRIEAVPPMETISTWGLHEFLDAIWRAIEYNHRVINQIDSVKLVIFDLDDTLWRGLIGEHYGDTGEHPLTIGWPLGVHEAIQHLRARGILVAICSKNDAALVEQRWDRPIPFRWISPNDFVCREIGWNPKVESIAKILASVSMTPKNVVFIDDNPVERESVRAAFPTIRVLGSNPFTIRRVLLAAPETQIRILTAESVARDSMIRQQQVREQERTSLSRAEFLKNLNCRVVLWGIAAIEDPQFARAFELMNKTNQFNTNGRRWSLQEIEAFLKSDGKLIAFTVTDKFTSYGLVGVILQQNNKIEQMTMSCRVLGLDVETNVLRMLLRRLRQSRQEESIHAYIVETEANMVCRDVYRKSGFADLGAGTFSFAETQIEDISPHINIEWR
jgi:FkbH-like protein